MAAITNHLVLGMRSPEISKLQDSLITQTKYVQSQPRSNFTGSAFTGEGRFVFTVGAGEMLIPSRSYFEIRDTFTAENGAVPLTSNCMAPVYYEPAALFSKMELQLDNQTISRIIQDYPQIAAYRLRTQKIGSYNEKLKQGLSTEPSFLERSAQISSNGKKIQEYVAKEALIDCVVVDAVGAVTSAAGGFIKSAVGDIIYTATQKLTITTYTDAKTVVALNDAKASAIQPAGTAIVVSQAASERSNSVKRFHIPALSVCADNYLMLPPGEYTLIVNTVNNVPKAVIQSLLEKTITTAVGLSNANYSLDAIYFHACVAKIATVSADGKAIAQQTKFKFPLYEVNMYRDTGATNLEKTFSVGRQVDKIAVAFQNNLAGSATLAPATQFICGTGQEKTLTSLSVQYNNQIQPSPDRKIDTAYTEGGAGGTGLRQCYMESALTNDLGIFGAESYQDWLDLGPIHSFKFNKQEGDKGTDCTVRATLGSAPQNVLIFTEYPMLVEIEKGATAAIVRRTDVH